MGPCQRQDLSGSEKRPSDPVQTKKRAGEGALYDGRVMVREAQRSSAQNFWIFSQAAVSVSVDSA